MKEEFAIVTRSIGFPINILKILDEYSRETGKSRTAIVMQAVKIYLKDLKLL